MDALDKVRIRYQKSFGYNSKEYRLLNINSDLHDAYLLKEMFLDLANYSDYDHAEEKIKSWIEMVYDYSIPEMIAAANTIKNWLPYIVNSFIDERFSNGFTEGLNNKIKVIKRVAFGYKNFEFLRLRILYIMNGKLSGITKKDRNSKK